MKQMNTDEVYNRTMINTTWVKKAGGGTCNVPSTEEAHEVKRLLCDLYDHERGRDKRITTLERDNPKCEEGLGDALECMLLLEERLTALGKQAKPFDGWFENLDKRITALEGDGEDNAEVIQDHQTRITDIETLHYRGKYPARHNYIEPVHNEPKPRTCGDCRNAYWQGEEYNGLCGKCPTVGGWIRRTWPRCTKDFEAVK